MKGNEVNIFMLYKITKSGTNVMAIKDKLWGNGQFADILVWLTGGIGGC